MGFALGVGGYSRTEMASIWDLGMRVMGGEVRIRHLWWW